MSDSLLTFSSLLSFDLGGSLSLRGLEAADYKQNNMAVRNCVTLLYVTATYANVEVTEHT